MIDLRHKMRGNAIRRRTCVRSLRRIGSPCRTGGATYCPLADVQGTIWGYVEADNSIVARFEYDAWGNILSSTSSVPALATNRYRFQCREWSAATGLVNFRARWYDPVTGRWLSKDPIGLSGGLNLYAFCDGNPVNYVDPSGTIIPAPLLSGLLGALGGGIVGGSLTFHNGGSFWAGFVGGAISGAITGATMGAIPFALPGVLVGSGINAVSGAIGSVVEQKLNGQNINWHQVGSSALIGGITGVVGGVGGSVGMASKEYWVKVAFGADAAIYTTLAIWENNQCE